MSSTYLDRAFYFYMKIWKTEGLIDIIVNDTKNLSLLTATCI